MTTTIAVFTVIAVTVIVAAGVVLALLIRETPNQRAQGYPHSSYEGNAHRRTDA